MDVKNKKMTRFLCQELLYEFERGVLDSRREKDVREHLADCKESQRELEKLKKGIAYTSSAAHLKVSSLLHQALLNFEPNWQKQLREWTLWSSQRGWKMLPYIFVVLTIATGLFVFKPWRAHDAKDVILAEQLQKEPDMIAKQEAPDATLPKEPAKPDETATAASPTTTDATAIVAATAVIVPPKPQAQSQAQSQQQPPAQATASEKIAPKKSESPAVARGFIMRGDLDVTDFANSWPAIREKILALDGKVAGNVELGWLRRTDQSYFHFTLPESNYAELELFLGTFGPVRFVKERNPRVMPEGQIRIILTVKDAVTHEEGSAETP